LLRLPSDRTPIAAAAARFLGPAGAALMTVAAILSTLGSASALLLVGPRILYAFSRAGRLPEALSRIHPLHRTPHVAIAVFSLVAFGASLAGSFAWLAALSAIARLVFSAATCLAVPILRRRMPRGGFPAPRGPLVPLGPAAPSLWLLAGINGGQALAGAVALITGCLLYLPGRRSAEPAGRTG